MQSKKIYWILIIIVVVVLAFVFVNNNFVKDGSNTEVSTQESPPANIREVLLNVDFICVYASETTTYYDFADENGKCVRPVEGESEGLGGGGLSLSPGEQFYDWSFLIHTPTLLNENPGIENTDDLVNALDNKVNEMLYGSDGFCVNQGGSEGGTEGQTCGDENEGDTGCGPIPCCAGVEYDPLRTAEDINNAEVNLNIVETAEGSFQELGFQEIAAASGRYGAWFNEPDQEEKRCSDDPDEACSEDSDCSNTDATCIEYPDECEAAEACIVITPPIFAPIPVPPVVLIPIGVGIVIYAVVGGDVQGIREAITGDCAGDACVAAASLQAMCTSASDAERDKSVVWGKKIIEATINQQLPPDHDCNDELRAAFDCCIAACVEDLDGNLDVFQCAIGCFIQHTEGYPTTSICEQPVRSAWVCLGYAPPF
jgi:hypothetical protein